MIIGVSKWFGKKVGIEEKYMRLIFTIAIVFYGVGLGFYVALWLFKIISKE